MNRGMMRVLGAFAVAMVVGSWTLLTVELTRAQQCSEGKAYLDDVSHNTPCTDETSGPLSSCLRTF
jgi:hypothetical protein